MNVFSVNYKEFNDLTEQGQHIVDNYKPVDKPKCEKLELLEEINEYYGRKENQKSMPLWLAVRIEKVIKKENK